MIEKRMLVGSSQIQPQSQPQKRPRRRAPIRKKVCNTEPIRGVLPPEPDRETMQVKDGYFAWEPLDSDDDSDEGEGVVSKFEADYCSLMAGRKEEKEIWRPRRESFKQEEEEKETSNKPRKGQWFYVFKGDMIQH